ncbi:5-oxoprolinase-like protein [Tanacetum coccineum]
MAIGTGHRSNNYSESKRNDHLDNNRRQEQRNKGIPNKSHPNFREEHKSFSSIFVSNIPWNASVQDLWDICNKWGVVIDVYIAAKRSKSGHRFGFVYKEAGNEAVMSISVDDCIDLDGMERSILAKVKDLSVISELLKHRPGGSAMNHGLQRVYKKLGVREAACLRIWLIMSNVSWQFEYWAPNIESMEVNSESNPLERKDAEGPSLDESLENEEHLDVDSCDSDSPKNVNNDSVSPSSRYLCEEEDFDCMEKNLEDDAGKILGVHSQGDCGNVTTDDNEDVTPVIAV